jgi:hypothetical protein
MTSRRWASSTFCQPQDDVDGALPRLAHTPEPVDVPAFKPDVALALLVAMRIMF